MGSIQVLSFQSSGIKLGTFKSINESLTRVAVYISLTALYCLGGSKVKAVSNSISCDHNTSFSYYFFSKGFPPLIHSELSCSQGQLSVGTMASFIGYTFTLTFAVSKSSYWLLNLFCFIFSLMSVIIMSFRFKDWLILLEIFVELLRLLRGSTLFCLEFKLTMLLPTA